MDFSHMRKVQKIKALQYLTYWISKLSKHAAFKRISCCRQLSSCNFCSNLSLRLCNFHSNMHGDDSYIMTGGWKRFICQCISRSGFLLDSLNPHLSSLYSSISCSSVCLDSCISSNSQSSWCNLALRISYPRSYSWNFLFPRLRLVLSSRRNRNC